MKIKSKIINILTLGKCTFASTAHESSTIAQLFSDPKNSGLLRIGMFSQSAKCLEKDPIVSQRGNFYERRKSMENLRQLLIVVFS